MKTLGSVAIGIGVICLIIGTALAFDQAIYSHTHHPPFLVTIIIFVVIGTILVYVGIHVITSKQENGSDSDLKSKNGFSIFMLLLIELDVTVETLLYSW